jgi:K+-transporting ATPase KdpF subunit
VRSGDLIGLIVSVIVLAYLVFGLLNPEKL